MAAPTLLAAKLDSLSVERVVSVGAFSALHGDDHIVVLRATPSATAADKTVRAISQICGLRLVIEGGEVRAEVHGVDHRLPVERSCSIPAALAFAAAGVPTVLLTDHSVGEGSPPGAGIR